MHCIVCGRKTLSRGCPFIPDSKRKKQSRRGLKAGTVKKTKFWYTSKISSLHALANGFSPLQQGKIQVSNQISEILRQKLAQTLSFTLLFYVGRYQKWRTACGRELKAFNQNGSSSSGPHTELTRTKEPCYHATHRFLVVDSLDVCSMWRILKNKGICMDKSHSLRTILWTFTVFYR